MDKRTILINRKDEFEFEKKYNYPVMSFFSKIYPRNTSVKVIKDIKIKNCNNESYSEKPYY
jgi:hypothetical protein